MSEDPCAADLMTYFFVEGAEDFTGAKHCEHVSRCRAVAFSLQCISGGYSSSRKLDAMIGMANCNNVCGVLIL